MSEYALEFCILAVESRSNEIPLLAVFWKGLSKKILKELAYKDPAVSLDALIDLPYTWISGIKLEIKVF